jgi:hypothetical protein
MVKPEPVMLGNTPGEPPNIMGKGEVHSHDIIMVWFNNFQKKIIHAQHTHFGHYYESVRSSLEDYVI